MFQSHKCRLSVVTTMMLLVALFAMGPLLAAAVEANRMAEVSFESAKDYADPFNHVTLDAVFTTPDGRLLRVPAFWAGGKTWRVRYAAPHGRTPRLRRGERQGQAPH